MIRKACRRQGLALDVMGIEANGFAKPEQILADYEIVFAKARCALEALAVGNAVILCDHHGLGQMVTSAEVNGLRRLNFGHRTLRKKLSPDLIAEEIAKYDANDAKAVSQSIRATCDVKTMVDNLLAEYGEVLAEFRSLPAPALEVEHREAAAYLQWLSKEIHSSVSAKAALKIALSRIPIIKSPPLSRLVMKLAWKLTTFNENAKR